MGGRGGGAFLGERPFVWIFVARGDAALRILKMLGNFSVFAEEEWGGGLGFDVSVRDWS